MTDAPAKKAPAKKAPAKAPAAKHAAPEPTSAVEPTPAPTPEPETTQPETPDTQPDDSQTPDQPEGGEPEAKGDGIAPQAAPLDAPPVQDPPPAPPVEIGFSGAAQAVHRALAVNELDLYDAATGGPINPDDLFGKLFEHATYVVCRQRVIERVDNGPNRASTNRLLIPRGAHLSLSEAAVLTYRIKQANEKAGVTFDEPDADTGE